MKIAIVHYWLVNMRGGEKVIEALLDVYPDADVFCHVYSEKDISRKIASRIKGTTFVQKLPFSVKRYQAYLPFMPLALEELDLTEYDLVISSESGPAKGVVIGPDAMHICYCHSPMRYVWDMYYQYKKNAGFLKRIFMPFIMHYLRMWDVSTSHRVTHFIANSNYVSSRLYKYYNRKSIVINPPVDYEAFELSEIQEDYYLIVGQLVDYKKADMAIRAFNISGRRLVVIGEGEQLEYCKKIAAPNVSVLGKQPFSVLKDHYSKCKALIFPGIEDFGIVPLEVMASGRPVLAYKKGGALETVLEGTTGLFFAQQTEQAINDVVDQFEKLEDTFDPEFIRNHALGYSVDKFKDKIKGFISSVL